MDAANNYNSCDAWDILHVLWNSLNGCRWSYINLNYLITTEIYFLLLWNKLEWTPLANTQYRLYCSII